MLYLAQFPSYHSRLVKLSLLMGCFNSTLVQGGPWALTVKFGLK